MNTTANLVQEVESLTQALADSNLALMEQTELADQCRKQAETLEAERDQARAQIADLQSIDQYRMQMAGISTAAIGYWKEEDAISPEYDTPSLRDVAKLYAKYAALHAAAPQQNAQASDPIGQHNAEAAQRKLVEHAQAAQQTGTRKIGVTEDGLAALSGAGHSPLPLTDEQVIGVLHSCGIDTYPSVNGFTALQVSATSVPLVREVVRRCMVLIEAADSRATGNAQAALSDEQYQAINEAAETLESSAAFNRYKSRTILADKQQGRADRLRLAFATRQPAPIDRAAIHRKVLERGMDGPDVVGPTVCTVPPAGWYCTRAPGHDGPCAAHPIAPVAAAVQGNALSKETKALIAACDAEIAARQKHQTTLAWSGVTDDALLRRIRTALAQRAASKDSERDVVRCALCNYQYGHAIGCDNNPVDQHLSAMARSRARSADRK